MPNEKNTKQLNSLIEAIRNSNGVVFVDYQGVSTRELEQIRNSVEELGASFHIAKNTLLRIALMKSGIMSSPHDLDALTSPTAALYLGEDIISPLKKLTEYTSNEKGMQVKGGILDNEILSSEQVIEISKLPAYDELIAKLIGQIQAPIYGLVYTLNAVNTNLVNVLDQIRQSKGGEQ